MPRRLFGWMTAVAVGTCSALAQLPPELLFQDGFEVSAYSADINFEYELRQTGTRSPMRWLERGYSAGPPEDNRTFVTFREQAGKLFFWPRNGGYGYMSASPARNFIDSPRFEIECLLEPAINDAVRDSTDWVSIAFGASNQNVDFRQSNGVEILFFLNGSYQVIDSGVDVMTGAGLPKGPMRVRIAVESADFLAGEPARIALYVDGVQRPVGPGGAMHHVRTRGFTANYVTLTGFCGPYLATGIIQHFSDRSWFHAFDDFKVSALHCIRVDRWEVAIRAGETSEEVMVTVPQALVAAQNAQVTVRSLNPNVAEPAGGTNGELTLVFPQGGPPVQAFQIAGKARGKAVLVLTNPQGVCVNRSIGVEVSARSLLNPSFELDFLPGDPGHGPITGWESSDLSRTGLDAAFFADNGAIPDRFQVAFIQGGASLSQRLVGLQSGQPYWIQFFYNASTAFPAPDLRVTVDGAELARIPEVRPVGEGAYAVISAPFVAAGTSPLLVIENGSPDPDSVLLLDAVSLIARGSTDHPLLNPGFEASGGPFDFGGVPLAGWEGMGIVGTDASGGPQADNGLNPEQEHLLFLQSQSAVEQRVTGLEPGAEYELSLAVNARSGPPARLQVLWDDLPLVSDAVAAVGGANPFRMKTASFQSARSEGRLRIEQTELNDVVLLVDGLRLRKIASGVPLQLAIARAGQRLRISWPSAISGAQLEASDLVSGGWSLMASPPVAEGAEWAVYVDPPFPQRRFFRLRK